MRVGSAGDVPLTRNTAYMVHECPSIKKSRENVAYKHGSRLKYHSYDYPDTNTIGEILLRQNRAYGENSSKVKQGS